MKNYIRDLLRKMGNWIKSNRLEFIILLLILLVGTFLRLYKIDQYMTFLGDEGRDALVVRRLLVNGDLIFVGPGTSVGNMYLGPLYYYLIAPALLLANFSPVGPAVTVALLGVFTIFLVYWLAKIWFGSTPALSASFLYAISPTVIIYSRHSWNPNIMPAFALLCVFSLWKVWAEKRYYWLIVLGISYALVLQSHYLGLVLLPLIVMFWILTFISLFWPKIIGLKADAKKNDFNKEINGFVGNGIGLLLIFVMFMSPLIVFDARYHWRNFNAMLGFFLQRTDVSGSFVDIFSKVWFVFENAVTRLIAGTSVTFARYITVFFILMILALLIELVRNRLASVKNKAYFLLLSWLTIALLGLSIYKHEIYDHYMGFMFPLPFLLTAAFIYYLKKEMKLVGKVIIFVVLISLIYFNIHYSPLKYAPNRQLQKTIDIAKKIMIESEGQPFNLAVIADRNYEGAYQYFLESWNAPLKLIDPQKYSETLTDQLFVVCEYEDLNKCQPTSNPKAEVANFGWSKISQSWVIDNIELFKLVHNYPN